MNTTKLLEAWNRLAPLQQGVVRAIEQGYSPREAYRRAGGSSVNLKSIDVMVCQLLAHPNVKAYRNLLAGEAVSEMVMSREEMRLRLTNFGRADISDIARVTKEVIGYTDEGDPVYVNRVEIEAFDELPDSLLSGVSEVVQKKDGVAIKMRDAVGAMKLLAELDGHQKPRTIAIEGFGSTSVTIATTDPAEAASQYQALMG